MAISPAGHELLGKRKSSLILAKKKKKKMQSREWLRVMKDILRLQGKHKL